MDYFIFKGKSSQNFDGIYVTSLPPITKPEMRIEEIVVDGKDGSKINELGYSSYKKTIEIVKLKEVDIEELKGWLNGEGRLILSNEIDKYYNARIIESIDYSRFFLYEKDTITFLIQPFKYSLVDNIKKYTINSNTQNIAIRNVGNIYSKPILTIKGTGNIIIYLNNKQMFSIALGNLQEIVIDTENMEAYQGNTLLNRIVIGDYDDFKLEVGKNIISWSGGVESIEIKNFSRWI